MSLSSVFNIAGSGMSAQSTRLNTISSNIANAETVSSSVDQTYRARHPVFATVFQQAGGQPDQSLFAEQDQAGVGVQVLGVVEDQGELQARYEPNHPAADEAGYVYYPNVNVVEEMADMISASRAFQTNAELMNTAKTMLQKVLTLGQ
ncbi:flagellar basal body rod protein FlgC [Stutzerimonas kunmingensis]|jgi:flagellar basal-body rod protein FlgC|uniref:Flagellar basal-body rod protein FlgC n=3 Tax=Stutzerimonas stutzeri subgroup TaxID=578833 RepID=A0A9X1SV74_9GAMM|nr:MULTISPECIES: flagellar basal body rod protein FlgC [Stutzerimonas stutzeri group]KJS32953.1 MAG: flagellar basal body rod protein FlgC [Pseudomonas sp. BRH_c35]MAK88210.1 flagellar basal body rod protein FlgC [Pseudomonas sp.]MBU0563434.1 flagellar basal body rod protein FlgC [Gammaproteobacteria bacterium]MCB4793004.1 flagellar basal body rod protein FlgC [Pseudomonas sp. NP21570]OCX94932.1 MAG: flagellar basal body rod protein FlgC [Pseudomonas sp. K35]RRU92035.1 flagellar basal body ro|tara:strand:- start:2761 stop:3204 length:444 start_codon:yes stop_codon:yes gene_type:complete